LTYCVPMVTEESSVVAAASSAAKFWMERGGIHAVVLNNLKVGHVHFYWGGTEARFGSLFEGIRTKLIAESRSLVESMEKRGGGLRSITWKSFVSQEPGLFQLFIEFDTRDSMGANFINTVLEQFSVSLQDFFKNQGGLVTEEREVDVIMSILSNYTPDCLVKTWVECPIEALGSFPGKMNALTFAERFYHAVRIAQVDPFRACTHNKGIFNAIDAVALATGNDFRSIEACGHTYASRQGKYQSLSQCTIDQGIFRFWMELPLAVGTIGGLTSLHPIAKRSLEMLENPGANELMMIIASAGLIQNFAALRSLITTGIQQGHMRMHLNNVLIQSGATEEEKNLATIYFSDKTVSVNSVKSYLESLRSQSIQI
jgi:hydroxymethylglutaryl-CoA reductase